MRELLLQEARRCGLRADPLADAEGRRETEEEALIRGLIDAQVTTPAPDEDACRRYYEHNRARFRSADIYEASHILIAARRDDAASFTAARERAAAIHAHLESEPQRFAELAKAHSDCPSGASGGNLGQLTAGDTTPEFEQALLALKPGDMSGAPVETRYGFHVIRLDRHVPGRQLPFEIARERIAAYLAERSQRLAIAQFVARLAARADVAASTCRRPAISECIEVAIICCSDRSLPASADETRIREEARRPRRSGADRTRCGQVPMLAGFPWLAGFRRRGSLCGSMPTT